MSGEIQYRTEARGLRAEQAEGFFVGWPNPPTAATLLSLLAASDVVVLAMENDRLVGYVTAISDGVLFSFVSSLEVLPGYQGRSIGAELMRRVLEALGDVYATDLVCDAGVVPFYEKQGLRHLEGMGIRRYDLQSGPQ